MSGGLDLDLLRTGSKPADSAAFRDLMDQTREVIESPNFVIVLDAALDWGIDLFLDDVGQELFEMDPDKKAVGEESHRRLAAILPSVARWSHTTVDSLPNELVEVCHLMYHRALQTDPPPTGCIKATPSVRFVGYRLYLIRAAAQKCTRLVIVYIDLITLFSPRVVEGP